MSLLLLRLLWFFFIPHSERGRDTLATLWLRAALSLAMRKLAFWFSVAWQKLSRDF